MLSPDAFAVESGPLALGEHRVIRTALGDTFSGSVAWLRPGQDLLLTVDELNGGTFRISTWQAGGQTGVQAWLAAWEPAFAERVRAFQPRAAAIITQQLERP
jgi:hypothetical protein